MRDQRVEKVAEILVDYSTRVQKGELALIWGSTAAEPLTLALHKSCLERGAHPIFHLYPSESDPILYRFAQDHQLDFIPESERWLFENVDVIFRIIAETNTRQLMKTDPDRKTRHKRARKPLLDAYMNRAAEGELRWVVTMFPTEAEAMEAQMSLQEFEDFYYGACLIDTPDPVAEWRKVGERHARLIEWMQGRNEVHIEGEGTDLILEVGGRTWIAANGEFNFPDGEFFTGPIETATRGHISFTYPAIYEGQSVEGIRLDFEGGSVVEARAQHNEEYLIKMIDADPGARVVGELGIGTNYGITAFTGEILMDEKIGGTVHLALGSSYPESGGTNDSAVHWDMVCDLRRGGRITVDGETLMEDGKLLIP